MNDTRETILAHIDELQRWFATKRPGWRETATPGQLQQWEDRVREEERLLARLELMN